MSTVIDLFRERAQPALMHDADEAIEAAALIFGNRPRQLVALDPSTVPPRKISATFAPDDDAAIGAWLSNEAAGCNVYYAHAERRAGAVQRRKIDLVAVHWLHVDLDPAKGADVDAERARIEAVLASPPEGVPVPSLILDSGRGFQALWRLEGPLTDLPDAEARNRWLRDQLGGDPAAFDATRILRLPGTVNYKPEAQGRCARLIRHEPDAIYAVDRFGAAARAERAPFDLEPAIDELDRDDAVAAGIAICRKAPPAIAGDGGRTAAFTVGMLLKRAGVSLELAQDLALQFYDPRCSPPDADWMRERIERGWIDGEGRPGCDHPTVKAEQDFAGMPALDPFAPPLPDSDTPEMLEWGDEDDDDRPLEWLLKNILTRNGVGIIFGAPKSGKSFAVFDLAARLTLGMRWFNVRTPKEPIGGLLLLGEGAGTVRTRLRAFRQSTGAAKAPITWRRIADLKTAAGIAAARRTIAAAKAGAAKRGMRLGFIVVDSLASALGLEDENSATEVTAAMKVLEDLAIEFDVAVLGVHHAGKNGQDRGSGAFRAACDVMLRVQREDAATGQPNNHRQIAVLLNRYGDEEWTANFRLDRVVLGVDEDGDEITSCIVAPAGESPVNIHQREIIMGLFDPATIHLNGFRLPGDEWGITRKDLRTRCAAVWDDMSADAVKKRVQRSVAELIQAGRLKEIPVSGAMYLVAIEQRIGGGDAPASLF